RKLLVSRTLKEYVDLLDDQSFYRVHQSHLVNLNYVDKYKKRDGGIVITSDGAKIPVARARKEELLVRLMERD
ncbi:MAG: LytTR family DNA-binding domain-containing protein, partial [Bacteroidota bacterium]